VYPTPVNIPLLTAFSRGTGPFQFNAISIPLSLLVLGFILVYFKIINPAGMEQHPIPGNQSGTRQGFHWHAWAPFITIIIAIPVALFALKMSHPSMINFIMLAGAGTAIVLADPVSRASGLSQGAKHAGLIIFDICGAGALGFVIVKSGFAQAALGQLTLLVPVIFIPFLLSALIETAQGSRVVTAVITTEILSGTAIAQALHPVPLILIISAGSCIISYVTDPFFWLVQRTTGDDIRTVVKNYTIPVALAGMVIFLGAVLLENGARFLGL
jgi:GntP family gluconate:H+ symporter